MFALGKGDTAGSGAACAWKSMAGLPRLPQHSLCPSSEPRRGSQLVPRCSVVPELGTSGIQVLIPSGAAWPRKPAGTAPELIPLDQPLLDGAQGR